MILQHFRHATPMEHPEKDLYPKYALNYYLEIRFWRHIPKPPTKDNDDFAPDESDNSPGAKVMAYLQGSNDPGAKDLLSNDRYGKSTAVQTAPWGLPAAG